VPTRPPTPAPVHPLPHRSPAARTRSRTAMPSRAVVWFRRDLRLADHPALLAALAAADQLGRCSWPTGPCSTGGPAARTGAPSARRAPDPGQGPRRAQGAAAVPGRRPRPGAPGAGQGGRGRRRLLLTGVHALGGAPGRGRRAGAAGGRPRAACPARGLPERLRRAAYRRGQPVPCLLAVRAGGQGCRLGRPAARAHPCPRPLRAGVRPLVRVAGVRTGRRGRGHPARPGRRP
jgi:DNA photolyase